MSTLKELNDRLSDKPYVSGFVPSKEDAKIFEEMFGTNCKVIEWAARMASYYQSERELLLNSEETVKPVMVAEEEVKSDESDVDIFGEATEEETAALEAKKAKDAEKKKEKKKAEVIAKSSILMDIKPYDDTVDLEDLAKRLHAIERDGLVWGSYKLMPIAFGLMKLQQLIVIEDDKVAGDDLEEMITDFPEVQSIDIVAWNKI